MDSTESGRFFESSRSFNRSGPSTLIFGQLNPAWPCTFIAIRQQNQIFTPTSPQFHPKSNQPNSKLIEYLSDFSDYKGKYVVLFFYPLDFTFVCPTEIIAFSEASKEMGEKLNTKVIAASTDSNYSHLAWINTDR